MTAVEVDAAIQLLEGVRSALPDQWPALAALPASAAQRLLPLAYVALVHAASAHGTIESYKFDDVAEPFWHLYLHSSAVSLTELIQASVNATTPIDFYELIGSIDVEQIPFAARAIDCDAIFEGMASDYNDIVSLTLVALIWRECGASFFEPGFVREAVANLYETVSNDSRLEMEVDWDAIDHAGMNMEACRDHTLWQTIAQAVAERWPIIDLTRLAQPEWLITYAFSRTYNELLDTSERAHLEYYNGAFSDNFKWSNAASAFAHADAATAFLTQWNAWAYEVSVDYERSSEWFATVVRGAIQAHSEQFKPASNRLIDILTKDIADGTTTVAATPDYATA